MQQTAINTDIAQCLALVQSIAGFQKHAHVRGVCVFRLMMTGAFLLFLSLQTTRADYPDVRFRAESVESGSVQASGVELRLKSDGAYTVSAARIQEAVTGVDEADVQLAGQMLGWSAVADAYSLNGLVNFRGLQGGLRLSYQAGGIHAALELPEQALSRLLALLPDLEQSAWVKNGDFSASLALDLPEQGEPVIDWAANIKRLSFDSPEGLYAGEGLAFKLEGGASFGAGILAKVAGDVTGGELLIDRYYSAFNSAPLLIRTELSWPQEGPLSVQFALQDDGALALTGHAVGTGQGDAMAWDVEVQHLGLEFPLAYQRYVENVAAAWTLDGLEVTGRLNWSGGWQQGAFYSGNLEIEDLSVVDTQAGRFALTGLYTELRPGDHTFDSTLDWRGLLFGPINLGAGRAHLDSEPGTLALARPLDLAVLGGRLHLERLRVLLPGTAGDLAGESDFRLKASLHDMDMERLTTALDWPRFGGVISGELPGATLTDGVLAVEGGITMRVFDGTVSVNDLRVERPFGVLPSLAANIDIERLDLGQLTETFSFGNISGRLDGYVHDLRMLEWRPVAFDAWLGTPAQQDKSQGISRQAVNRLTTIGGGSATTALTSPIMRMFSNFSYKRLGLGCRLQNYACEIRGLSEDEGSVLLLEGAGIPKITIRAYNRQVDWPQMVANLLAVSGDPSMRIGSED